MRSRVVLISSCIVLALALGAAFFAGSPSHIQAAGTIYYVDAEATGAATGLSWTDAYTTVQDALSCVAAGDEIWVAAGIYYPDQGAGQTAGDRESTFQLPAGVALYGGFAGDESSRAARDWTAHITVLSGDLDGNDSVDANGIVTDTDYIVGYNAYTVVYSQNVTETTTLDGFTVTAGCATDTDPHDCGAGMRNDSSDPKLANLTFIGNVADRGGGMYNWNSSPTLNNVTFHRNEAIGGDGGGMYNIELGSEPILTDVTFSENTAFDGGGGMANARDNSPQLTRVTFLENNAVVGGGMYNEVKSCPTLTDTTFISNTAAHGGGMYNDASSPKLITSRFTGNTATNGAGMLNTSASSPKLIDITFKSNVAQNDGGGINNENSSPTLNNVIFNGNTAHDGGGMRNEDNSHPVLVNVTFTGNTTTFGDGGGMENANSSPILVNVAFYGNHANAGGGMSNINISDPKIVNAVFSGNTATFGAGMINQQESSPTLINVTVTGNVAEQLGGGIGNNQKCYPALTNCIVWGNSASDGSAVCGNDGSQVCNTNSSAPDIQNSDVQGSGGSTSWDTTFGDDLGNNIDADPQFLREPDPDDGDWTTLPDNDYGNLHLGGTSPAIDAGDNTAYPQDDSDIDDDGDTAELISAFDLAGNARFVGGTIDMGAYESFRVCLPLVLRSY